MITTGSQLDGERRKTHKFAVNRDIGRGGVRLQVQYASGGDQRHWLKGLMNAGDHVKVDGGVNITGGT